VAPLLDHAATQPPTLKESFFCEVDAQPDA